MEKRDEKYGEKRDGLEGRKERNARIREGKRDEEKDIHTAHHLYTRTSHSYRSSYLSASCTGSMLL